jgi:hypothetical protein
VHSISDSLIFHESPFDLCTSNGHFDLDLTMTGFSDWMIFDEDKWFANLLDKESSLCCHCEFVVLQRGRDEFGCRSMGNW